MATPANAVEIAQGNGATLLAFPASWLALELDRAGPNTAAFPETAREVWRRIPEAVAMVDGPMFSVADGRGYTTYERANLLYRYLDTLRGISVPSRYPTRGATLSVAQGVAAMLDGAAEQPGSSFAIQGYPAVARNGRNVANPSNDTDTVGRAAICLLSDGRVGFAIDNAGMYDFTTYLLGLRMSNGAHVTDAAYTDGGGSTALALRNPGGPDIVARGMDSRRLPAYILAIPPAPESIAWPIALTLGMGVVGVLAWMGLRD